MNDIHDVLEHVLKANNGAGVTIKQIQEIMFMTYGYSYEDTRRAQEALKEKPKSSEAGNNYWVAGLNSTTPQDWDAVRPDMVNSPPHYTSGGIETIDFIKAKLSDEGYRGYLQGNLLKYASRIGKKGSDDAGKAAWYADRLSKCGC
jgi:hypothetical protein